MQKTEETAIARGDRMEAAAWESVWAAASPEFRAAQGLSSERLGGAVALRAGGVPWWFMNRIVGLGLGSPADLDWLAAQIERYRAAGTPFGISVSPEARPAGLADWLLARGLRRSGEMAKMERSTKALPDPAEGVVIREVGVEEAGLFGATGARCYGLPDNLSGFFEALPGTEGWRLYMAWDAGEPVATGALFQRGDVAWLGFGAVDRSRRGKGLHGALMLHRMHAAAATGCRLLVTETGMPAEGEAAPSFHNMRRLGFELVCARPDYLETS
ncbi:GNAT family N-acetyltransferase [Salipiger sp. H15]|uniref:GNAT family N-acetyltransferase n=1 Tax=Alloyangia sp. H15 TaxID=3029062 RepID=A0AAU8ALG0_9RHOB